MRIVHQAGVHLPDHGIWLDPHFPKTEAFVSHAHFDHMRDHTHIVCSEITGRFVEARLPAHGPRVVSAHPFHTPFAWRGLEVQLLPAGHIFGSAMLWGSDGSHSILFTGDFKLRPGRSAEPCHPLRADTLIMETTYGLPRYAFPPTAEVLRAMVEFCRSAVDDGDVPVLIGYSLGKSQEILASLHEAGLPVMLHSAVHRMTRLYQELAAGAIPFPPFQQLEPTASAGHVVIVPPGSADAGPAARIPNRRTAAVTGWAMDHNARFRHGCDAMFPLSDHADYPDLLRLVEQVQPRCVLTLHGFASEFAADLRARGMEAWALTGSNQLELAPLCATARRPCAPTPVSCSEPDAALTAEALGSSTFAAFVACCVDVRATTSKKAKTSRVAALLRALPAEEASVAARFLTGRSLSESDRSALNIGAAIIREAVCEVAGCDRAAFRAVYNRHRDLGFTAEELLRGRTAPQPHDVAAIDRALRALETQRGPIAKGRRLADLIRHLASQETEFVVRILTGDLRIGLKEGLIEEAIAAAFEADLAAVREANMLSGDIAATTARAIARNLHEASLTPFSPIKVMLASPEPTAEAVASRMTTPFWVEHKFDGIRCQLHRVGPLCRLFSRDLRDVTPAFPEIAAAALRLSDDVILDGELLAFDRGRALPFAELQKRLGRKEADLFLQTEVPLTYLAFDMLWHNGTTLLKAPLRERRAQLESLHLAAPFQIALLHAASSAKELDAQFYDARQAGDEGLMIKDPQSPYLLGRRGFAWLKLKKEFATLDAVVVAAEYGHGKRNNVLSDLTFAVRDDNGALRTIGKAYSGLTDREIAALTAHFLERTVETRGRLHLLDPDTVIEVAFDAIQPSDRHDSGFALRFPRIKALRPDKSPADIDTLAFCARLATGG